MEHETSPNINKHPETLTDEKNQTVTSSNQLLKNTKPNAIFCWKCGGTPQTTNYSEVLETKKVSLPTGVRCSETYKVPMHLSNEKAV